MLKAYKMPDVIVVGVIVVNVHSFVKLNIYITNSCFLL